MSKNSDISDFKVKIEAIMDTLVVANASIYGGNEGSAGGIGAALSAAVMAKAKKMQAGGGIGRGVSANDWISTGREVWTRAHGAEESSVDVVCDTCSALALYILSDLTDFSGRAELFADTKIHHHFVVVNRDPDSDSSSCGTWGDDSWVIDIWQAKFAGNETTSRGWFSSAHHYKHGVYRNSSEHTYTQNHGTSLKIDATFDL